VDVLGQGDLPGWTEPPGTTTSTAPPEASSLPSSRRAPFAAGPRPGRLPGAPARRGPVPVKRVVFAALAVLVAGALGTGAYVLYALRGTGDVLERVAPADTDAYVAVYLDPALEQKLNLRELLSKFPAAGDVGDLDAKLDEVMGTLFRSVGAPISFSEDVRPGWDLRSPSPSGSIKRSREPSCSPRRTRPRPARPSRRSRRQRRGQPGPLPSTTGSPWPSGRTRTGPVLAPLSSRSSTE
jgi:hypothetical protein